MNDSNKLLKIKTLKIKQLHLMVYLIFADLAIPIYNNWTRIRSFLVLKISLQKRELKEKRGKAIIETEFTTAFRLMISKDSKKQKIHS